MTKLKFEAKTFHIYANQKEVRVYMLIKTLSFLCAGAQEVKYRCCRVSRRRWDLLTELKRRIYDNGDRAKIPALVSGQEDHPNIFCTYA